MRPLPRVLALLFALAIGLASCQRKSGPSPNYDRAQKTFAKLYGQKLDDAYLDPAIVGIEEDLQRVPPDSVDAEDARALAKRIADGRAQMEKAQEDRRAASASARQGPSNGSNWSLTPPSTLDNGRVAAADAGQFAQPTAGMSRADFEKRFLGCFEQGEPVDVRGRGLHDSYQLKDITNCRERHPGFEKTVILLEGNTVLGLIPRSSLVSTQAYADGGVVPSGGGASPDAGATAETTDAGTAGAGY